jgi:hypothetical protein
MFIGSADLLARVFICHHGANAMRNFRMFVYVAVCLGVSFAIPLQAQPAPAGAASKEELAKMYRRNFEARDAERLQSLVYWPGVAQRERDTFVRSMQKDLKFKLKNVEVASLGDTKALEYTLDGTIYRPTLAPIARLVATYEGTADMQNVFTSYLVGVKDNRYFITLASRVSTKTATLPSLVRKLGHDSSGF